MTTRAYAATLLLARQFALGLAGCLAWIVAGCSTPAELAAWPLA